jgi:AcrR family transcriptional regulator
MLEATLALLRERGIGKLTTREVAARAGVSEASVYYHFTDRAGLLQAVFEHGVQPLEYLNDPGAAGGADRRQVLTGAARALDRFFDEVLPVLIAAQADPELRASLTGYMAERNLGPHRGVKALGAYLEAEQAAGRVGADVDVEAAALMLIGSCFTRVVQRQMLGQTRNLPSIERVVAALDDFLAP